MREWSPLFLRAWVCMCANIPRNFNASFKPSMEIPAHMWPRESDLVIRQPFGHIPPCFQPLFLSHHLNLALRHCYWQRKFTEICPLREQRQENCLKALAERLDWAEESLLETTWSTCFLPSKSGLNRQGQFLCVLPQLSHCCFLRELRCMQKELCPVGVH